MITKEQLFDGFVKYIDSEIIPILSTGGKWVIGAGVAILSSKYEQLVNSLISNDIVKSMGIVDSNGLIDSDLLIDAVKSSASKYGALQVNLPFIGTFVFKSDDLERLRKFMPTNSK